jgi:hypothetical protein
MVYVRSRVVVRKYLTKRFEAKRLYGYQQANISGYMVSDKSLIIAMTTLTWDERLTACARDRQYFQCRRGSSENGLKRM